ncbi:MAG: redox-sensing transcriptional repressor Rex [Phycisphaerales bacterium]|nr:redox-sensing transcriptional repressor Rex [Phycisphaerales bacterium]
MPNHLDSPRPTANIPLPAIKRLSLYLREVEDLLEAGRTTVSSKQLGEALSLTDAQVRKDLGYFGQFGQPGIGYNVSQLAAELRRLLGSDQVSNVCLVGVGNIGRALLDHGGFRRKGFHIVAAFDVSDSVVGQSVHGVKVAPMADLARVVQSRSVRFGIVAVPAAAAQSVCDQLVKAGVTGILNFAPKRLQVPPHVSISSVDLAVQLEQLAFQVMLAQRE